MSKTRITAFFFIALIVGAFLTNPSSDAIKGAVKDKAKAILVKQLNYEHQDAVEFGMALFGDRVLDEFIQNNVIIKNYYLFSTVSINWQGEQTPIGGGAFKQVWISEKIDEKADEIIGILKNL